MPFTLVHPVAVLPLIRRPLVVSALVAGAIAPDVPYYFSLQWLGGDYNLTLTHTATSVLWLDPAIALVLLTVWKGILEQPLARLLSESASARVAIWQRRFVWATPRAALWIVVSAVLGAATHLLWDGLDGAFDSIPSTRLDLISDALGTLVLLIWLRRWWVRTPHTAVPDGALLPQARRRGVIGGAALLTVAWGAIQSARTTTVVASDLRGSGGYRWSEILEVAARQFAIEAGTALVVVLLVYATAWHFVERPGQLTPPS